MNRNIRAKIDELAEKKSGVLRLLAKWTGSSGAETDFSPGMMEILNGNAPVIEEFCPVAPPLEEFLKLPSDSSKSTRLRRFFIDIRKGDIVYGSVYSRSISGLVIRLRAMNWSQISRSIDDLAIKAVCPSDRIPSQHLRRNSADVFDEEDLVRAVVLSVNPGQEKVTVSLLSSDGLPNCSALPLGLVSSDELPKYFRLMREDPPQDSDRLSTYLRGQREFNNPAALDMLRYQIGVPEVLTCNRWYSLLPGYCGKQINPGETAEKLTLAQSAKWSMKSVEEGVALLKEGDLSGALSVLNKAVEMDKDNIEALVARGAVFTKKEDYHRAIKDFEHAIKLKPNHRNAKKYLSDTFFALGKKFEVDEPEKAVGFYKDAIELDHDFEEAILALDVLQRQNQPEKKPEKPKSSSKPSKRSISTTDRLRQMLHGDEKSASKHPKRRSRSRSNSPKRARSRKSSHSKDKSTSGKNSPKNGEDFRPSSSDGSKRNGMISYPVSRDDPGKIPPPAVPMVDVDLDDLEAQLERFRAQKKAQVLATNQDVKKKVL